jgi:hypothetical protein
MFHSTGHKTPIAVFAYSRPLHLQRSLESLSNCLDVDRCDVFIFCDGPREGVDRDSVFENRRVAHEWSRSLKAKVIEREHNYGLTRSILSGITDICSEYGRIIVLEDDIVVSPYFVQYMLAALERYQSDERVFQVSGFMYPVGVPTRHGSLFLPVTTSWGWGTWQRAWRHYDADMTGADQMLSSSRTRYRFNLDGSFPYADMLMAQRSGSLATWDIQWYWTVFKANGLALYPSTALTQNIGFDGSGTHYTNPAPSNVLPQTRLLTINGSRLPSEHEFPMRVRVNRRSYRKVKVFLRRFHQLPRLPWLPGPIRWLLTFVRSVLKRARRHENVAS